MSTLNFLDKKTKDKYNSKTKIEKIAKLEQKRNYTYLENEPDGYILPENETEKTLKVNQKYLKENLPKFNSDNIFDLTFQGPTYIDYTRNGKYLLLGNEDGDISLINWRSKDLITNFRTENKISNIKFLQNESMFAVAEQNMLYIYDRQGIELHSMDYFPSPKFLEYLPYHFLLVAGLKNNAIKYQDISIGKVVSEIQTKSGFISSMGQNPNNGVIITGHSNGLIQMWTPNYGSTPVLKIFAHNYSINTVNVDLDGNYLITTSNDSKMKIWDLRNSYKCLYEYFTPNIVTSATISQKNLLAISYGNTIDIWKDYSVSKQKEPYMKHHFKDNKTKTSQMKFVNFEDFLGVGTSLGFSSICIPGSGMANFDTFENNPYETKNQRRENEVKNLLEKIPYDMIALNPNQINKVDVRSKKVINAEKEAENKRKADEIVENQKKKIKSRLKNKQQHDQILKEFKKQEMIKAKVKAMIELQQDKKEEEKSKIKKEVKVLQNLAEDFDPELYIQEKENSNNEENESESDE